jgi:serine/threonine-protein kinase
MPLEQQVDIMSRISEGLAFARAASSPRHQAGEPVSTADNQVKILDFGVARIASSQLTRSGLIVGTPDYMSPEQVMGKVVDERSDIFSAGAVFYQLLSGRKPFASTKLPQILQNVMSVPPAPLAADDVPVELASIVMKALEKDPALRYQRIIEMLASLTRFLQGWDRQTREIALKACEQYQENERLLAARAGRTGGAPEEVAAAALLRDLPLFQDRGAEVLKVVPFRRGKITEIARVLQEQHDRLLAERP